MADQRVFVIWTNPLFHASVRLLLNYPEVEWVGESRDYAAAQEDILDLRPDIILIEELGGSLPAGIIEILETSSWGVRLVGLSLDDNELSIYHRDQWTVGKAEDLVRLIITDPS